MGMNELESKMKRLYNDMKSGKITNEIVEEANEAMHGIEKLGGEVKEKFKDMMGEMKESIKNFREKL